MTDWTPPPPGDTSEQLPDRILSHVRRYLPPYLSTACETGRAVAEATLDIAVRGGHTNLAEWAQWRDRMHQRCRKNHKFSGQLCRCHCHKGEVKVLGD